MPATTLRVPLVGLVCLGVWLHAADALVATTVMPSAIAEIGGLPWIYWTIALYELGSIVAGAVAGLASLRLGLGGAMAGAALIYGLGCVASALAPGMAVMLGGRLVQGLGGGAMVALSYVGVSQLFAADMWPRVLALISGVWGISALVGPLVGGAFASAGLWRGAFWAFAAQALLVVALAPILIGGGAMPPVDRPTLPGRQIMALTAGVLAVSAAGVQAEPWTTVILVAGGLAAFLVVLRLEQTAADRLFPPRSLSIHVPWGPGYAMVLALATATVSFTVYGPLLMAKLFDTAPLVAGLMVASESFAWTLTAIVFARAPATSEAALIRGGATMIATAVAGLAFAMPRGPVWALLPWVSLQGAGFGMCWAFVLRRIVATVPAGEQERASAAMPTFQMIGYAIGAAVSGIVANGLGLADGAPLEVVRAVAFWVFAAFLPLGPIGIAAAFRLTARRA